MGNHKGRVEWENPLPSLLGPTLRMQTEDWPSGLKAHTVGSCPDFHSQEPTVLLGKVSLNDFFSHSVFISGIVPNQVQDLILGLVELLAVLLGLSLKLV